MVDHYQVLGIPRSASAAEIKSAFKKLALRYHPDRNPDYPAAEEKFKEINRAYQILSDPYKKHQYDLVYNYQRIPVSKPRSTYRPFYYPPYEKRPRHPTREYEYGWKYVKAQVMAFAFIFIVAAMVMGVKYLYDDYQEAKEIRLAEVREVLFKEAQAYFDKGEYRKSLDIIILMQKKNPAERTIRNYRDKFVGEVLVMADSQFYQNNFESAIISFSIVKDYQRREGAVVYKKLAECYKALGMYQQAADALEVIRANDKKNLKLNLDIGILYLVSMNDPENSKQYLDNARYRVKDILVQIYGQAAELVMNPAESPPIYFEVFFTRAKAYTQLGLHEDAIKDCNWSVFLRPDLAEPLYIRGTNYFALGNNSKACKNWKAAAGLNYTPAIEMMNLHCN